MLTCLSRFAGTVDVEFPLSLCFAGTTNLKPSWVAAERKPITETNRNTFTAQKLSPVQLGTVLWIYIRILHGYIFRRERNVPVVFRNARVVNNNVRRFPSNC